MPQLMLRQQSKSYFKNTYTHIYIRRVVSLMNLFHPIKSPFDFSNDNGYFHTEHLAFLITKQTTTLQGNHFKVIIARLSSPINPITMTQPRKNTIWARGSSLLQTVSSKEATSSLFFSPKQHLKLFNLGRLTQVFPCHPKKLRVGA